MNTLGRTAIAAASMAALAVDLAAVVIVPKLRIQRSETVLAQTTAVAGSQSSTGASSGESPSDSSSSSSSSSSSDSSSSSSSSASSLQDGTYTGSVTMTRRGDVQVRITVSGGKVTAVDAVQYPQDNPTSSSINAQVIPIYVKEALAAQSSSIQVVSGATETYDGFTGSLQDAIAQAGR